MGRFKVSLISSICIVACLGFSFAQKFSARNSVPETIASCYRNTTAYNRYTRLPMHIENLIAIVRKIEQKNPQWDMRRIARTMVNRYMFDGIEYNSVAKPEFAFIPMAKESIKTDIIKSFIPLPVEEMFPSGTLDNDEMCSLHWMLSHSMNATVRDEELLVNNPFNPGNGYVPREGPSYDSNNPFSSGLRRGKRSPLTKNKTDSESNDHHEDILTASTEENSEQVPQQEGSSDGKSAQESTDDQTNHDDGNKTKEEEAAPVSIPENVDEDKKPSVSVLRSRFLAESENLRLQSDKESGDSSAKFARQVSTNDPGKTRRPIETGVVYTKWGSVSAGRVIAGIAAGLEPMTIPIGNFGSPYPSQSGSGSYNPSPGSGSNGGSYPYGGTNNNNPYDSGSGSNFGNPNPNYGSKNQWAGRKKRQTQISLQPLQSVYAATLAGDIGQAAIMNGQYQLPNISPPKGHWNDTVCPKEYILQPHPLPNQEVYQPSASWSFLTEAEIRGGMDGLILGLNANRWDVGRTMRLSDILSMYYSETGIVGDPSYRSCNRGSLYSGSVDGNILREQSRSFAYLFNNQTNEIPASTMESDVSAFYRMVDEAHQRMSTVASNIGSSDAICTRRQSISSSVVDTDDNLKFTDLKNNFYVVLDHTATVQEIEQQKRFIAQLVQEINVRPQGARLGVVDGSSGLMLINPNLTDISARLSCNIIALPTQIKTQDIPRVLNAMKSELQKLKDDEKSTEDIRTSVQNNGLVLMFMVQGKKFEESQKSSIRSVLNDIDFLYGDTQVIFASSKYQKSDFDSFALRPDIDFMKIQPVQNISDAADEFADELRKNTHGRLTYPRCHSKDYSQDDEHKKATDLFILPDTIQYYKVSPDYFYSAKNLRMRFTSDNGKVRICESRSERFPNSKNGAGCRETTGTYITPGSSQIDIEYSYSKPCGKNGDRKDCSPIYFSFTPTSYPPPGSTGLDCTIEGCQSSNEVKVTITHWDMRCNGALLGMIVSLPMALTSAIISLLMWKNST